LFISVEIASDIILKKYKEKKGEKKNLVISTSDTILFTIEETNYKNFTSHLKSKYTFILHIQFFLLFFGVEKFAINKFL